MLKWGRLVAPSGLTHSRRCAKPATAQESCSYMVRTAALSINTNAPYVSAPRQASPDLRKHIAPVAAASLAQGSMDILIVQIIQTREHREMDEPIKLLPCPFCGGAAELDSRQYYRTFKGEMDDRVCVYCTSCSADMGLCKKDVPDVIPEHVADMWNARADNQLVEDMVLMIGRLAYKLKKSTPDDPLPARALDFLKRNGITISPLCR